nr:uncharacterized protein LOC117282005 [Nicotiana tomentosiformis]
MDKIVKRVIATMQSSSTDEYDDDEESDEDDQSLMAKEDSDTKPEDLIGLMATSYSNINDEEEPEEENNGSQDSQVRTWKHQSSNPLINILTPVNSGILTRLKFRNMIAFTTYIFMVEPKNINEALEDADWIVAMQEELNQFEISKSNPKELHLKVVKRILRHLKGTQDLVLWYPSGDSFDLIGYVDTDNARYLKQNFVALSTAEAKYVVVASCCAQLLRIKQQLEDYGIMIERPSSAKRRSTKKVQSTELHLRPQKQVQSAEDGMRFAEDGMWSQKKN